MSINNLQEYFNGNLAAIVQPQSEVRTDLKCSKCGETKPIKSFHKDSRTASGYHAKCKICRGGKTDKPKRVERRIELKVWFQEAAIACPCVVCGDSPALPNTVEAAREWLGTNVPLCEAHRDGKNLKARMAARTWSQSASERLLQIEVWHDVTTKFKNIPRIRIRYQQAKPWLAGVREFTSNVDNELNGDMLMNLIDEVTRGIVARDMNTDHLPTVISNRRWTTIREFEVHMSDYEDETEH